MGELATVARVVDVRNKQDALQEFRNLTSLSKAAKL
jgi:hypothetical protein